MICRAFVVEDDPIYSKMLRNMLGIYFKGIECVGTASTVEEVIKKVNLLKPDLVFLDINLGDRDVFEALKYISYSPRYIFTSSVDTYALRAFEYEAVDYLIKPLSKDLFINSVTKALNRIRLESKALVKDSKEVEESELKKNYLTISYIDRYEVIKIEDIVYCEADGRYTHFYLNDGKKFIACKNLAEYEHLLCKINHFFRISRSVMVNFKYIKKILKKDGLFLELNNGDKLPIVGKKVQDVVNYFKNNE